MKKTELLMIGLDGGMTSYVTAAVAEGRLPNFRRILENGVVMENCMTAFPSITPTCWTTIATGAAPAVSNAIDHMIHIPGTPLDATVDGYDPANLRGMRFWEAAVNAGKRCLISEYPAMPQPSEDGNVWTIGAYGTDRAAVAMQRFRIGFQEEDNAGGAWCAVEFRDGAGRWMPADTASQAAYDPEEQLYTLPGIADPQNQPGLRKLLPFTWQLKPEDGGVRFGADRDSLGEPTKAGEWTAVVRRTLSCEDGGEISLYFQGKVLSFDPAARTCEFYIGAACQAEEIVAPEAFRQLVKDIPGFTDRSPYRFILYADKDNDSYAEAYGKCADWKLSMIRRAFEKQPFDILIYYEGYIDTVNHIYRPAFENLPGTDPARHALAVDMYAKAYDLADRTIGRLLDEYADENTTVVLVSDHGSVGNNKHYRAYDHFVKEGLTVLDGEGKIDWSKTVAYANPLTSGHAFVNLKGRDPDGIVEPQDYDAVVARIIEVLNRTSDGGVAFALDRREADLVGQGGDSMCGDVIYGLRGGLLGGNVGGVHAAQSPSAKSPTGDIRSMCVFSGPAFRRGVTLNRLMDETDIAPTVNYAMGYPLPADATGGVILQALKETR